jgi:guanylate kinase
MKRCGVPLVVSAPSGTGKTTLCRRVMGSMSDVEYSVSHTTRPRRGQEIEGRDYFFVDDQTFDALIEGGLFLEWAHVHGRRYGTSKRVVEEKLASGVDLLFDIDVQGGRQVSQELHDAVLLFVLPPSMAILEERLRGRQSDSEEQIQRRLTVAKQEVLDAQFYTHWLVNDDLEKATQELKSLIMGERLQRLDRDELLESWKNQSCSS